MAQSPIANGSFETADYTGWTLFEGAPGSVGNPNCGVWGIGQDGQTISQGDVSFDFFDGVNVTHTFPTNALPLALTATDGDFVAFQLQNCTQTHRISQAIDVCNGATDLTWDMQYESNDPFIGKAGSPGFAQELAIEIRDVPGTSILATLFTTDPANPTVPGNPLQVPLQGYSADISAFAGQTVQLTVDMQVNSNPLAAVFDNFRLPSCEDADGDGVQNSLDLCPATLLGDAVDANGCSDAQVDGDGDGVCDPSAPSGGPSGCSGTDNCPFTPNASQADFDGDGEGDACDADDIQALCADATVPADGSCQADANIDNGSFDPDGDGVDTAQDPSGPYGLGSTTVTLMVDDIVSAGPNDVPAMCMAAVTVVDETAPDVTASLIPVGAGDEGDDDDEGRFQISFSAIDNCAHDVTASCTAVLEAPDCASIEVVNGQVIEFEVEDDECEVELEDGLWEIEGPDLTLTVNCVDPAGNIGTATAMAEGLAGDNDGEGDSDD